MATLLFPSDFLWGAATSAYQIEGATGEDGRGESIWDRFARRPGATTDGLDGAIACDHYHRFREDVALMKRLGVRAYRFSVAWPRVQPTGRGPANAVGIDFYRRLVDELLGAGIVPFATLYHWDLPQALEDQGGWPARATAEAFVEYASIVTRALGDRVKDWITHNEPWCAAMLGYLRGIHAPGRTSYPAAIAAAHHLLLSHGWAVPAIRREVPGARVGITLNLVPSVPASPSDADRDACRHHDGQFNRWFLDPLYGRGYPADVVTDFVAAGHVPPGGVAEVRPGDLDAIAAPCDFLGVNYYMRAIVRSHAIPEAQNLPRTVHASPEATDFGWEVYPEGLHETLARVHRDYAPGRVYVTECGASYATAPDADGRIADEARRSFLHGHFDAARRAIDAGVPLGGFFVWSLLDNFEWDRGYTQRFGVVWVDYATQVRTPKDSARWYQRVIAEGGIEPLV